MTSFLRHSGLFLSLTCAGALAACQSTLDRIEQIGQAPPLSPISVAPGQAAGGPVYVPQPPPEPPQSKANSLWRAGSRSFFRDPRAQKIGDILTVSIDIGDQAKIANTSTRTTNSAENANLTNFLGFESRLK